jgi:uncharacterized membrane protein YgcG
MTNMFKRLSLLTITFCAIFTLTCPTGLIAQGPAPPPDREQISSYDSNISVNPDSTLLVRENLKVFARGAQIKHGIYRDVPTRYNDRFGNPYLIHFEVVSVERDDLPEDFHLERLANGLRIYMGKSSELVSPGEHTYTLTYSVDREIGFFPDHDELYWNVTGNGWVFPIQMASATVHLPRGIAPGAIMVDAYTGRQGSVGGDYTASADGQSNATFRTTRALEPSEGMSVVARWPKGFVHPPTDEQEHQYFLEDNRTSLIGLLGLFVVLVYYTAAWLLVGRDPARGEITPRSEPPRGFSPAALRYVWRMAFDPKTLVANLVDLAVKKQLAILEDGTGSYILGRLKSRPGLAAAGLGPRDGPPPETTPDEKLVLDKIFAAGETIRLEPANHALVGGAAEALHHHLRSSLEKVYFMTNGRYLIPGLLISLATVVRCGFSIQGGQRTLVLFVAIWLLLWSLACLALGGLAIAAWRNALSDPHHAPTARNQALLMSAICLPFFIGEAAGLGVMAWAASTEVVVVLMLLVAINYLFHVLLKAPTGPGRALLDQIEGFRMFLTTTEQDRRNARTPSKNTPEVFERFLPYAIAFNVEKVWGEKFAAALAQTARGGTIDYSPRWYSGPGWDPITASTFVTSLGNSFSSAISSSTSAPGSSSGSRGSSGGGGGGGGGW